jgi:uncharacterized alpha-E superfamily protein
VLLSRVAEQLYWAGRMLERAEDTARLVAEHTNLLVDLPTSVPLTWEPLLAVTGTAEALDAIGVERNELSIIRFLLVDHANPGCVADAVTSGRNNLRACREIIPTDLWTTINDLHLYVQQDRNGAVERRNRMRFCSRVVRDHQLAIGTIQGSMLRDEAYTMLRIGRHLERADMTTRILDVRAVALVSASTGQRLTDGPRELPYAEVQTTSLLRSLAALQTFHRSHPGVVTAQAAAAFALFAEAFPRSVAYCLRAVAKEATRLPGSETIAAAAALARDELEAVDVADPVALHASIDRLQSAIAGVHSALTNTLFL